MKPSRADTLQHEMFVQSKFKHPPAVFISKTARSTSLPVAGGVPTGLQYDPQDVPLHRTCCGVQIGKSIGHSTFVTQEQICPSDRVAAEPNHWIKSSFDMQRSSGRETRKRPMSASSVDNMIKDVGVVVEKDILIPVNSRGHVDFSKQVGRRRPLEKFDITPAAADYDIKNTNVVPTLNWSLQSPKRVTTLKAQVWEKRNSCGTCSETLDYDLDVVRDRSCMAPIIFSKQSSRNQNFGNYVRRSFFLTRNIVHNVKENVLRPHNTAYVARYSTRSDSLKDICSSCDITIQGTQTIASRLRGSRPKSAITSFRSKTLFDTTRVRDKTLSKEEAAEKIREEVRACRTLHVFLDA